jgi:phosphoglycolate phosphatase
VPGIADAIAELAATRRLAVATSKAKALAEPLLAGFGLLEHFELVAGPDLAALDEDKTTTARRALEGLGAETATMIGDTRFDLVAAQRLGLRGVGVTWGIGSEAELREAGADAIVHRPAELPAVV